LSVSAHMNLSAVSLKENILSKYPPAVASNFDILEAIPLGVAIISKEGVIEFANSSFLKISGVRVGVSMSEKPFYQNPELNDLFLEALKGKSFKVEVMSGSLQERNERYYRYQSIPINTSSGKLFLVIEDITAARRLEKDAQDYIRKLREDESRFIASINSLSIGFMIIDVKSNTLIKNQAIDNILGLTDLEGNVLLRGDIEAIEAKLAGSCDLKAKWEKSLESGNSIIEKEVYFGTKFLSLFIAPVTISEAKERIGVVILIEDITEAKVLARSKDEFFSIASHELRTPLTAIRGNTAMIKDYYSEALKDPQLKAMVDDIHESSIRLIGMVNDFLDLSRLEQGKMVFNNSQFDFLLLVQHTTAELATLATEKKIFLKFDSPKERPPIVTADKDKVKQVLSNLIGNAIKFTENGGVTISLSLNGNFIKTSVIDTGRGITPENQVFLFRKFQQAGTSLLTRDTTKGTGLGLYISKLLIEGMGGTVVLEKSEPEKGSTFAFTLPLVSIAKPKVEAV